MQVPTAATNVPSPALVTAVLQATRKALAVAEEILWDTPPGLLRHGCPRSFTGRPAAVADAHRATNLESSLSTVTLVENLLGTPLLLRG